MRPKTQAGALPIAIQLQFEHHAAVAAWSPMRTFCRSMLLTSLSQHIRISDALNARLKPDELRPESVARATSTLKQRKNPVPLELYSKAEGWLGPFGWLREHLAEMSDRKHAIPAFDAPCGRVSQAARLRPGVATPEQARQGFYDVCRQPPLSMADAERVALGIRGHSPHVTASDFVGFLVAIDVWAQPLDPSVPARPFGGDDANELGHWMKPVGRTGQPGGPPGGRQSQAAQSNAMPQLYRQGSLRRGGRELQLDVRARLVDTVRRALAAWGRPWWELPRGREDWDICKLIRGRPKTSTD